MIYLIEMEPVVEATGEARVLRYGSAPFVTLPTDTPANTEFEERVADPGNYERFLFSRGRTRGESSVGGGDIVLVNADGELDDLLDLAFDGRRFTIWGLEDVDAPWSSRQTILVGTMEQATFPGRKVEIRIRDRLDFLREPIQTQRFKGTTTTGDSTEAEGNVDLKDVLVPELFGTARTIPPIVVDPFNRIFRVARRLDGITAAYDTGVLLTATQDYATLALLKAATLQAGQYATCLVFGLIRTQTTPGSLTVDAYEGATLADRSAARIVQRMMPGTIPLSAGDFDALHAANPAECGLWIGTNEVTILSVAMAVLNSVGGSLSIDRFGIVRVRRLELPSGSGAILIDETNILDRGEGFSRSAPSDDGQGVPSPSITLRWGRSNTVYSEQDLKSVATTEAFRSFATQEWRVEEVKSEANEARHPKGPKLTFDTCFANRNDALAEANRLMAIYGARRDVFNVEVASDEVATLDLGDVVTLAPDRFGMADGVPARVTGIVSTYATNVTELELWR